MLFADSEHGQLSGLTTTNQQGEQMDIDIRIRFNVDNAAFRTESGELSLTEVFRMVDWAVIKAKNLNMKPGERRLMDPNGNSVGFVKVHNYKSKER